MSASSVVAISAGTAFGPGIRVFAYTSPTVKASAADNLRTRSALES